MSAQDEWVNENLDILREMQLSGMDVEEYAARAAKRGMARRASKV